MTSPSYSYSAKNYSLLTKPGIIMGNLITTAGGFALASKGNFSFLLFLATLLGLGLLIASSCVCNNLIDRVSDKKMKRTQNRPLVTGAITTRSAALFAIGLGLAGTGALAYLTNWLTLSVALFGFLVYVTIYSFSKYHTVHGTLIGSVAGAVPPVVGYCAVSNQLDLGAYILFAMIVLWQMPHFFAIAIYRKNDYDAASIPVVPLIRGIPNTKIQMLLYTIAFAAVSLLLTFFNYTGLAYLIVAATLGLAWIALAITGFTAKNDSKWARKMFIFSLITIMALSITIPFSVL
ncbi:MAG: heme o synthase [Simkaniaceae bacterium]|nr:heme o synthase [Candidatus Sacchlamyda saccharinae]